MASDMFGNRVESKPVRGVERPPVDLVRDHGGPNVPPAPQGLCPPPVLASRDGWGFIVHVLTYSRAHWLWMLHPAEAVGEFWRHAEPPTLTRDQLHQWIAAAEHGDTLLVAGCTVMAVNYTLFQAHAEIYRSMGGRPANERPTLGPRK